VGDGVIRNLIIILFICSILLGVIGTLIDYLFFSLWIFGIPSVIGVYLIYSAAKAYSEYRTPVKFGIVGGLLIIITEIASSIILPGEAFYGSIGYIFLIRTYVLLLSGILGLIASILSFSS